MARYIDADLLMRKVVEEKRFFVNHEDIINNRFDIKTVYGDFAQVVASIPTAEVEEVRHGHWFVVEYDSFHCSVCGKDIPSGADSTKEAKEYLQKGLVYPYCPRCGAKMDGGKAE